MKLLKIDPTDNVAVCLEQNGEIPAGHKVALCAIPSGEYVRKYGCVIGRASTDIQEGEWVHSHNLKTALDEAQTYVYEYAAKEPAAENMTFQGFVRSGRRAGIRNEIYIIPTVGCVNQVCMKLQNLAQEFRSGTIDGIFALTHPFGCSQLGQDHENIKRLLCSVALNPNASFVLFVGLGCENNGLDGIKQELQVTPCEHIAFLNCQDEEDEIAAGLEILRGFAEKASKLERKIVDASELCIGLKCGGSDGYSGITANPLVGRVTDRLVGARASAILTEVPEMFGAEQGLMNRCESETVFERYREMIERFKDSYRVQGFPIYENPSPGNKAGGITTLEEKSLGCVQKAGTSKIRDVLEYGERVKCSGVSVLNAPGNDLIAATALAASGCQVVLFTTGRGTPFSTFVPTLKIATNSPLAEKKQGWIDFDAYSMEEEKLLRLVLETASGTYRCKSENFREIAFYKTGVTL